MADTRTLADISQAEFDAAEAIVVSLIRDEYPSLDLRRGTVIRDLLVRPAASFYALDDLRLQDMQDSLSLLKLEENAATADTDDVNAILSNFGTQLEAGSAASGQLIVNVDADRAYSIGVGFEFQTLEGLVYGAAQDYIIKSDPDAGDTQLQQDEAGQYYFIITVEAVAVGVAYNVSEGTSMEPGTSLFGFVTAAAYAAFSGGTDSETVDSAITRLPAALSYRALESQTSIEARLRDQFVGTAADIKALSAQGYGDRTQLRDKHNPQGLAVGSRVDIYTRTFQGPAVTTLLKTATLVDGEYQFTISRSDAPGYYAIRSISDPDSVVSPTLAFDTFPTPGSYAFVEVRSASGLANTFHDIDEDNEAIEAAFTVYQTAIITVTDATLAGTTRDFKVELYTASGLATLQAYVSSTAVRNLEADHLVRTPLICLVGVNVTAYYSGQVEPDVDTLKEALYAYINTRSFVQQLTRSELVGVLMANGVSRVDLTTNGMEIQGIIRDAGGTVHTLSGDTLDLETIVDADVLLAPETSVFAAELNSITITVVPE